MNNRAVAGMFGVTPKQLSHLKARKPFQEGADFSVEKGVIQWTEPGLDKIASYLSTKEAIEYRESRGSAGVAIVLQEWDAELVEDSPQGLPDPTRVGEALALRQLESHQNGWVEEVTQAYQETLSRGLEESLGKHLGVPLEWVQEVLRC